MDTFLLAVIIGISLLLFITEWIRVDVVAMMIMGALIIAGILSPEEAVQGFSNGVPVFAMNSLPMTIEAENYDYFPTDPEGRTYHDLSTGNSGLSYRPAEGVDLSSASEGGFAISSIEAGEWVTYTVSVPASADYDLSIRYASAAPGGTIRFSLDGTDITGDVSIPHGAPASTGCPMRSFQKDPTKTACPE